MPVGGAGQAAAQFGQRQVNGGAYTASGYLREGLKGLILITSAGFTGGIGSAVFPSGAVINVPIYPEDYLGDIYFTVTAGTLYTIEVR